MYSVLQRARLLVVASDQKIPTKGSIAPALVTPVVGESILYEVTLSP